MSDLLANGRLIDLIFALVVIEVACLLLWWRSKERGIPPADLIPNVLAGAFLLLALRFTIAEAGWMAVSASLAAAGIAHLVDLWRRWQ